MSYEHDVLLRSRDVSSTGTLGARRFALAFFLIYCFVVGYATLLPFQFTLHRIQNQLERSASFLQLEAPLILSDLVGNVVLFIPIGVFALLMQPRRQRAAPVRIALAGFYGLLLSMTIELVQWFTPSRAPALSDITCNTLGTLLGAGVMAVSTASLANSRWYRPLRAWMRRDSLLLAFLGALSLTSAWALVPFDASLHPHTLARSLRGVRLHPLGGSVHLLDLTSFLFFALSAGVGVRWLQQLRSPRQLRNAGMVLGVVGAWVSGLETMQLALTSRAPSLLDVGTGVIGGVVGILFILALGRGASEVARRHWATVAYVAGLLFLALRPLGTGFGVEVVQRGISNFIPGYGAHFDATLSGVTEFVHALLLFVPLGYLLAPVVDFFGSRPWVRLSVPLACALLAQTMNGMLAIATAAETTARVGVLAACLGGVLGASARAGQRQLESARGSGGSFQTGTGFARKNDADTATSRPPLA